MDRAEFEKMKAVLDKIIDSVINELLKEGKGKKILDESIHQLIELSGGGTDDGVVIREMTYMGMASIIKDNPKIMINLEGKDFMSNMVSTLILSYRLGQFNTELQTDRKFDSADRAVDKLRASKIIHEFKDGKMDFSILGPKMRDIIMSEI